MALLAPPIIDLLSMGKSELLLVATYLSVDGCLNYRYSLSQLFSCMFYRLCSQIMYILAIIYSLHTKIKHVI